MLGYIFGAAFAPFLIWMVVWIGGMQADEERRHNDRSWEP